MHDQPKLSFNLNLLERMNRELFGLVAAEPAQGS